MSVDSSSKLTRYVSAVTVITAEIANSFFGGDHGYVDTTDPDYDVYHPSVHGHVHDGQHIDGHASQVSLAPDSLSGRKHVRGQLMHGNLGGFNETTPAVQAKNVQSYTEAEISAFDDNPCIPEYSEDDTGVKHYYLDLSMAAGGSDTHVQYNEGGGFGGDADFVYDYSTGSVGIGTDSPQLPLHIDGGDDVTEANDTGYLMIGDAGGKHLAFDNNEILARDGSASSGLYIQNSGTSNLIICSNGGSVGIGATDPRGFLTVSATNSGTLPSILIHEESEWGGRISFTNTNGTAGPTEDSYDWTIYGLSSADGSPGDAGLNVWYGDNDGSGTGANIFQVKGDGEVIVNGNSVVNGNAHITGKLTVDGLIDPTGLILIEEASANILSEITGSGSTNHGALFISDGAGATEVQNNLYYMDAYGVITDMLDDSDTTYTAGDGLDLSGTEFGLDLKSNGGLEIDSTELALDLDHSNIQGTLGISDGGTDASTQQQAINSLTDVGSATDEHVLTKDTSTGDATWKAPTGASATDAQFFSQWIGPDQWATKSGNPHLNTLFDVTHQHAESGGGTTSPADPYSPSAAEVLTHLPRNLKFGEALEDSLYVPTPGSDFKRVTYMRAINDVTDDLTGQYFATVPVPLNGNLSEGVPAIAGDGMDGSHGYDAITGAGVGQDGSGGHPGPGDTFAVSGFPADAPSTCRITCYFVTYAQSSQLGQEVPGAPASFKVRLSTGKQAAAFNGEMEEFSDGGYITDNYYSYSQESAALSTNYLENLHSYSAIGLEVGTGFATINGFVVVSDFSPMPVDVGRDDCGMYSFKVVVDDFVDPGSVPDPKFLHLLGARILWIW